MEVDIGQLSADMCRRGSVGSCVGRIFTRHQRKRRLTAVGRMVFSAHNFSVLGNRATMSGINRKV
jgi:hypothetical protein